MHRYPRPGRLGAFALIIVAAAGGCGGLISKLSCSGEAVGYDPDSLVASIRPAARAELDGLIGVASLADLPLYTIDIRLDTELLTFDGTQELLYKNRTGQPLSELAFRLYPNARQLNVQGSQNLIVENVRVDDREVRHRAQSATTILVPLSAPLGANESVKVTMGLRGTIPRYRDADADPLTQGLGKLFEILGSGEAQRGNDYGIFGSGAGIVSMGLWYPRLADRTPQGWDSTDPAEIGDISTTALANYRVSITTERQAVVVTTGSLEGEEASESSIRRTFVAAAVRAFAWQASRNYTAQERLVGDVLVRATFDLAHQERGARTLDFAAESLAFYEQRFGPYPYSELDVVEAPLRGGAGGIEWPGLVTIGRSLYGPPMSLQGILGPLQTGGASPSDTYWDETLEFVVAHEVSHQYWNAVVGSDSRNHPFVDEALAQFSACAYFGNRYGAPREQEVLGRQVKVNYHLHRLIGGADGPVDRRADQFANAVEYAGIVYGKGPYYFVALRQELGEGAFWQGMQTYYQRYRFRVAGAGDLPAVLGEVASNQPLVGALTQRWLHESHGDEDLGPPSLASVMEPIFGPEASGLLRQLEGMLSGGGAGGGRQDTGQILDDMIRGLGGEGLQDLLQGILEGAGSSGQGGAPQRPGAPGNQGGQSPQQPGQRQPPPAGGQVPQQQI